ncbi:unnamed protein product [Brassicogethes aeneus]|uniref:Uncharacterized protein n=1 Tax=Brassicogethes aeneus TaxID=1431903 RepID=A0A9P0FJB7_BRAAE|nr:unnamed protein product [Brassicogethes aeneus]
MGVHGLWRLIEPSGKPVPLETLENKVLAVDVSIWLHQAIKGFQDAKGGSLPNAHLLGIYHRVCKLLYFKIKPIFVFDGGVPVLKKQTIERRNQFKQRNQNDANKIQEQLLNTILKHSAISKVLSDKAKAALESQTTKKISPIKNNKDERDNMFILPATEFDSTMSSDDDSEYLTEETTETDSSPTKQFDLHTIETKSSYFKSLPADVRHEILTDLKETRKQSSWGRLHELPSQSNDFSVFQMRRLLKRQEVQSALEEAEKEMGGHSLSLGELETILNDHGVITIENMGKRIASDENTRYLLIKDIKQAMEKAKNEQALQAIKEKEEVSKEGENGEISTSFEKKSEEKKIADEEFDEDLKLAIALSLQEGPSTSKVSMGPSKSTAVEEVKKNLQLSFIDENFDSDSSEDFEDVVEPKKPLTSAQSYMMEYSGLTPSEIAKIIDKNAVKGGKKIKNHIGDIKQNVNKEQNIAEETQSVAEIKQKSAEETLSDDEDSDFLEVSDAEELPIIVDNNKTNSKIEIVVDPNKSLEDDLFRDIFVNESNKKKIHLNEENDDKDKINAIEIVVNPIVTPEDDLFSDIFVDESNKKEVQFEKKYINITEENMKTIVDINPTKIENTESILEKDDQKLKSNKEEIIKVPEEKNVRTEVKNKGINFEVQNIKELTTPEIMETVNIDNNSKENKKSEVESISGLSETELKEMKDKLKNQQIDLLIEKSSKERMAKNISDQMYQEAQELLELFGVPYIIAPMEAEAQCAFLDDVNLTDGTITDDSDIWLFGGKTVYKNFLIRPSK